MLQYKKDRKLRIGVAPTRRDAFAHPDFKVNQAAIDKKVAEFSEKMGFDLVTVDGVPFPEGADKIMAKYHDAVLVAEYFKAQKVDALFTPFCNFGQEEAVAKIAKELQVPVLVWGPRDPAPEGNAGRSLDTQCGIFAATKVLQRYGVTFTYIENCRVDEPAFEEGFKKFVATSNIVKAFRNARILQLSTRPQQFMSVIYNEGELLEKFGIEIVPVTAVTLLNTIKKVYETRTEEIDAIVAEIEQTIDLSKLKDKRAIGAIELGIAQLAEMYGCTAVAGECWSVIRSQYGIAPCFVYGDLTDRGLPCACETDIHGAISYLIGMAANGYSEPTFLADLTIRHPENDNAELLWHCGPYAKSLKKEGAQGWVRESGQGQFPIRNGEVTVIRFDGVNGKYNCFVGKGRGIDGPETNGTYMWLEVDDWVKWEKKFVYGPYIHHCVGVYGDYVDSFMDACRYLGLKYDTPDTPLFDF